MGEASGDPTITMEDQEAMVQVGTGTTDVDDKLSANRNNELVLSGTGKFMNLEEHDIYINPENETFLSIL